MSENALALVASVSAVDFFKPGASDSIISSLEAEARTLAANLDVSKPNDREAIRSLAAKLGKSKNRLDDAGKELVSGEKARLKLIDAERSAVWDRVEALQKEVRKPLTDWENAEKDRVAAHEERIRELQAAADEAPIRWQSLSVEAMEDRIKEIIADVRDMEEFQSRGTLAQKNAIGAIQAAIDRRKAYDAEQEELVRLRAESAAREQKEREDRIAREAEERERVRAEVERKRIEEEKFVAEARAKQAEAEKVAAIAKAEKDAKDAAELAEINRKAAEERHARDTREAEERAYRSRLQAVEDEKRRAQAEKDAAEAEAKKRESDKKHKAAINGVALAAFIEQGLDEASSKLAVTAIAKGLIPNVKVAY